MGYKDATPDPPGRDLLFANQTVEGGNGDRKLVRGILSGIQDTGLVVGCHVAQYRPAPVSRVSR